MLDLIISSSEIRAPVAAVKRAVQMDPYLQITVNFLNEIGLPTTFVDGTTGFIDHCLIQEGTLRVTPYCRASGLLHEAGHIAICPGQYRHLFSGNVIHGQRALMEAISEFDLHPDSPLYRAAIQSGECEATGWAWAAGKFLGIPDEFIIRDDEYTNSGEHVRLQLSLNAYMGINGLQHAGFCKARSFGASPKPLFPELAFWLQPEIDPNAPITYG